MALDDAARRYLISQQYGRLATVGPDGAPQNKPVGFVYNAELGTIDIRGFGMEASAKYRNIGLNPNVAFVVDDSVSEGAEGKRFLEVRGVAERVSVDRQEAGLSPQIIRIHPCRMISWNIDPDHPGFQTNEIGAGAGDSDAARPSFGFGGGAAQQTIEAVTGLVGELQAGWDEHDADVTDRHLSNDVLWGSPFGATLQGYEQLHAIHLRLKQQARGGDSSRFEIVRVLALNSNVAVAQVQRNALDRDGRPLEPTADLSGAFSEMALYVLVRRGGTWWLAAGQNTPVRPSPA